MGAPIDMTGQKSGYLTVLRNAGSTGGRGVLWECLCECGATIHYPTWRLRGARAVQSCGCMSVHIVASKNTQHGMNGTRVHTIWVGMRARCTQESNPNWKNYGGRGIRICNRWLESFEAFLEDMGEPPSPEHSIDRIDNDGNYEPGNCRWATRKEQCNNRRYRTGILTKTAATLNGETRMVREWCDILNLTPTTVRTRLLIGWSPEEAITKPVCNSGGWERRRARIASRQA